MDNIAHFLDVHSHKLTFSYLRQKPGEMIKHDNGDRLVFILISSIAEAEGTIQERAQVSYLIC